MSMVVQVAAGGLRSGHLAALAGKVRSEIAHESIGRGDLDVDDGLEHDRARLEDRVDHGLASRSDECDFRCLGRALSLLTA